MTVPCNGDRRAPRASVCVPSADHFAAFGSQFILQTASDFAMFRFLDDTMNVLLDFATPNRFVEAFVDDASNGLPFVACRAAFRFSRTCGVLGVAGIH